MALPMLVNGADCGPSNPLQSLSKRFDHDRGIQQDHFGTSRASSSRETFRTRQPGAPGLDHDAARFFATGSSHAPLIAGGPSAFDFSALNASLPTTDHAPFRNNQQIAPWASDFLQQSSELSGPQLSLHSKTEASRQTQQYVQRDVGINMGTGGVQQGTYSRAPFEPHGRLGSMQRSPAVAAYPPLSSFIPASRMQGPNVQPLVQPNLWDREFQSQQVPLQESTSTTLLEQQHLTLDETDDLARTAGLVVDTVKYEQNPKFQNSQFMELMKQLRDREVVVEGNQMVSKDGSSWAGEFLSDVKGKRKASEQSNGVEDTGQDSLATYSSAETGAGITRPIESALLQRFSEDADTSHLQVESRTEQDPNDVYFRHENEDYSHYYHDGPVSRGPQATDSWDEMQNQWDSFEATSTGIKAVENYQFQTNNPYLVSDSSRTRHHTLHSNERPQNFYESVLELEATVQRDSGQASPWFELGVKQQENEREAKAIQALLRAADLDPQHLPTWLALAVSYTNDGNRQGTYDAIKEWVDRNVKYEPAVRAFRAAVREEPGTTKEQFSQLIQCLMSMARSDVSEEVDADIQIALAVLLNTNEDFVKAQDCFRTALEVRPDDWVLYNRVGATMANSGNADDALQYYYRALELNPAYIRARYNLGISCINLRRYDDAAHHILDALVLQDSDGAPDSTGMNDMRGVTSKALWESLKTTCLHMQRVDLASLCDQLDLDGFRNAFNN